MFGFGQWRARSRWFEGARFSDELRRVLQRVGGEAERLGGSAVDPEHGLLAILASPDCEASRLLAALGVKASDLRPSLEAAGANAPGRRARRRDGSPSEPVWTSRAKRVLEAMMEEARALGHTTVDSRHFLLAIASDATSVAGRTLRARGVAAERIRKLVGEGPTGKIDLRIELDDRSDRLIYEQIVAQIQEAVATGRAKAGEQLPPIRQLADELDIAPGTVARAYGELEQAGVVVTDRTRGTFVAPPRRAPPDARPIAIRDLLRPAVVAAFHLGSSAAELRSALEDCMVDIYPGAPG